MKVSTISRIDPNEQPTIQYENTSNDLLFTQARTKSPKTQRRYSLCSKPETGKGGRENNIETPSGPQAYAEHNWISR